MALMEMDELSDQDSRQIAAIVREHLARRRISRQRLADEAKISISTLEKALGGSRPFTAATLVRLEAALGIPLRPKPPAMEMETSAPVELGSYARAGVKWLEGDYLTLRPSFEVPNAIYAYLTQIQWNDAIRSLTFCEAERIDAPFAQKGMVSVPNKSGHIYLHTNDQGQMRLAILGRPLISGQMYGVLTTLLAGRGTQLLPVSAPFALIPAKPDVTFGRVMETDSAYAEYRMHLNRIIGENFARLITGEASSFTN